MATEKMTLLRCLTCQQAGMPVRLDAGGFVVEHPGRGFPCRVPLGEMPLPEPVEGADVVALVVETYIELLTVRDLPAFWEARNTIGEAAFWKDRRAEELLDVAAVLAEGFTAAEVAA